MTDTEKSEAAEASAHWFKLAQDELDMDAWEEANGRPFGASRGVHFARHDTYIRTAEALRREAETGFAHCSSCGGQHAPHEHPSISTHLCKCHCGKNTCPWCGKAR